MENSKHVFIFCILPSAGGKNVVFTLLPGKIIRNVDCTAQEVEQGLARKEFSLLVNRKIQPFPPFSGKVAGGFQGAGKWDFRKK